MFNMKHKSIPVYEEVSPPLPYDHVRGYARSRKWSASPTSHNQATAAPLLPGHVEESKVPQEWPTAPKPIHTPFYLSIWYFIVDLALFGFSLAFFAFPFIVNSYDHTTTQEHILAKERLISASKYGPTVFPILFAGVVGRATHAVLHWRLEKGTRIGILDTLAGSTSLTSTVASQIRLGMVSLLGILLLSIWAMSPVGGQASLRMLLISTKSTSEKTTFDYVVPSTDLTGFQNSDSVTTWGIVNIHFNAALVGSKAIKRSPHDLWGNVKLPRIEHYENNDSQVPDSDGWYTSNMTNDQDSAVFTSLVGVPISGIEDQGYIDYRMNLQHTYLNLSCTRMVEGDDTWYDDATYATDTPGNYSAFNILFWWKSPFGLNETMESYRSRIASENGTLDAFEFRYAPVRNDSLAEVSCSIRSVYVEAEISCPSTLECVTSRIRRSSLDHPSSNITQLDAPRQGFWNWWMFVSALRRAVPGHVACETLIDFFVGSPDNPAVAESSTQSCGSGVPPGSVLDQPDEVWSIRLGQVFNTYWSLTTAPFAASGGLSNWTSFLDLNTTFASIDDRPGIEFAPEEPGPKGVPRDGTRARLWRTEGTRSTKSEIFQAHKGWIAALSIASSILIIASLFPPILRIFCTRTPELEMNISSLVTRNNPHIPLPLSGTFMDASDRAKALKNHAIRFGDIDAENDVGTLAFATFDRSKGMDVARIKKGRMYV